MVRCLLNCGLKTESRLSKPQLLGSEVKWPFHCGASLLTGKCRAALVKLLVMDLSSIGAALQENQPGMILLGREILETL